MLLSLIIMICFNTQPRGGGCILRGLKRLKQAKFQHTAARRRLLKSQPKTKRKKLKFQHTAARRRLPTIRVKSGAKGSFNTQPHGGGCLPYPSTSKPDCVSTHSRTEAAASLLRCLCETCLVSTHSRAKAAASSNVWINCI